MRPATAGAPHVPRPAPLQPTPPPGSYPPGGSNSHAWNAPSPGGVPSPNAAVRPGTATSVRSIQSAASIVRAKQEQRTLVALLRGTIADTYKEPPAGVTPEQIAARRKELEALLEAVQHDQLSTNRNHAGLQLARWQAALDDQVAKEQSVMARAQAKDRRCEAQRREFQDEYGERLDTQRKRRDEHTVKSFVHVAEVLEDRIAKAEREGQRREQLRDSLRVRRDFEKASRYSRQCEAEAHAEELLHRKAQRDREHQRQQDELMESHRRLAEERADRVRIEKDRKAAETRHRQRTANLKGDLNRVRVQIRDGAVKMVVEEVDYAGRLQRLRKAEADEHERTAAVLADKRDDRKAYEKRRDDVRRRIEGNHDAVVMQRLARQQEEAHVRDQRGVATAECKERHALETEEQSQLKTLMVIVHTERSHLRRAMRHDASHRKVFNRWTRKAGAIAEWVADSDCLSSAKAATLMSARGAPSSGVYEQQRHSPGALTKQSSMLRAASFTGQLAATGAGDAAGATLASRPVGSFIGRPA
jgi:hypothetical protein